MKDFLVKLKEKIDSGLFHLNDSLNMSNIDVLFEKDDLSNYKNVYAKVCEYLGVTDFDYSNDVALISNGQIVCHEGCEGSNLILLPVDLSTYFWKLRSSEMWHDLMGCEEIPDSIKKVMICLEPILPFVDPPAYVNETTEPNIYVSRVCYDSNANGSCNVYADTSIGVVRIGDKTAEGFKASECCWWCCFKVEDWEKDTGMNRWTKINVANATLDDIITGKVPV